MSYLKERILTDGQVIDESILRVDSFLNHQIDPEVMFEIEREFYNYFKNKDITKILTIEASGIAPALLVAAHFKVPMLFAKKSRPSTIDEDSHYMTSIHSYTKGTTSPVLISKEYLTEEDNVLIIDDFLANGEAALGLVDLVKQAGASVAGIGICIEKSFQPGRQRLDDARLDVYSICRVASLENNEVTFIEDNK